MQMHELKTIQPFFDLVYDGKKDFEIRKNDRNFQSGDILWLREYDKDCLMFLRRSIICQVTCIIHRDKFAGLAIGYCAMGIEILKKGTEFK
jgi:hypothetical protein